MSQVNMQELSRKLKLTTLGKSTILKAENLVRLGKIEKISDGIYYVEGSKDKAYSVEYQNGSYVCSCNGYRIKKNACGIGMCKHTKAIEILNEEEKKI